MNARHKKLIDAAQMVFTKYGVSKTTMNDIAQEAGVTRQTLYNVYKSKDAVLRAAVRSSADEALDAIEMAWETQNDLGEKLDSFFELGPLRWYDIIQASPEAADLVDGMHKIAEAEMQEIAEVWNKRFAALIREHCTQSAQTNAAQIADFLYSTSMNAKVNAGSRQVVADRLSVLKQAILALV